MPVLPLAAYELTLITFGCVHMELIRSTVFVLRIAGIAMHMLSPCAYKLILGRKAFTGVKMIDHTADKIARLIVTLRYMSMLRQRAAQNRVLLAAFKRMQVLFLYPAQRGVLLLAADKHILITSLCMRMLLIIAAQIAASECIRLRTVKNKAGRQHNADTNEQRENTF